FPDSGELLQKANAANEETFSGRFDDSDVLSQDDPHTITHRKGHTKFLGQVPLDDDDARGAPQVGLAAPTLCRLAFELAQAPDVTTLANLALAGLFESTPVDGGAVLIVPRGPRDTPPGDLQIFASRSDSEHAYHRVSKFL